MPAEATRLQPLSVEPPGTGAPGNGNGEWSAREKKVARLRLLLSQGRFLVRATAVGFAAALGIAFLIPARYESSTRLMPPDNHSNSGLAVVAALAKGGGGLGALGGEMLGIKSTGVLFVGMLESRTVEDDVVGKFDLKRVYGAKRGEDARRELAHNTEISEEHKSGIITIRVTDRSPERAQAMAAEYAEELNRLVNSLSTSSAHREREFLEQRLKAVQLDLEDAEKQFSQFASKNAAIDIKEQGKAMVEAAATLQGQLIAAESSLEGLKQVYTEQNVRVRSLEARVRELKSQLEKMGGVQDSGAAAASGKDSLYPSIRKLPLLGVTYADLYRRTKVQEAVFETLTQEYELAKVEEAKVTPSVKVLDAANLPERKSFPPRTLLTLFGTCLAFGAAVSWVLAGAAWKDMAPEDPRRLLGEQVWATARGHFPGRNGSAPRGSTTKIVEHFERDLRLPPEE
jgi:uncharacterized protein involved in exopolysaccharide biosynthesis